MKSTKISRTSRYVGTPIYQLTDAVGDPVNSYAFGVWVRPDIADSDDDTVHYVSEHEIGRLDLLSFDYYATPSLWWVIADKNGISDPMSDMYPGQELRLPTLSAVQTALAKAFAGRRK